MQQEPGVRLFDRNSCNVRLTTAGSALMPTVDRMTRDFDLAFRELTQAFEETRGRVVVGALPSVGAAPLPRAIARFHAERPQVEIVGKPTLPSMWLGPL